MDQQQEMEETTTKTSSTSCRYVKQQAYAAGDDKPAPAASKKAAAEGRFAMLTRFHAGYFRISLALSGQALLWRTLSAAYPSSHSGSSISTMPSEVAFLLLLCLALVSLLALCALYAARCLLRFQAVRAEFRHHVAMNYLFAPWISWLLLLLQAAPPFLFQDAPRCHRLLWCAFSLPILALDVKVYGQWFTRGRKFLSMVANPASHITVIGNLVTARAAAKMGWHEGAVAIFAIGAAHYLVLFVTLYQRFLGSDSLPAKLRPVFFLFFAAPSMASLAWDAVSSSPFGTGCKMLFFLSLFLFASLVCRPTLFKRAMRRFTVAWWAYSFPLTVLALAAAEYAHAVRQAAANALMLALAVLSVAVTLVLMVFTALRTNDLLPHDDPFDCSSHLLVR